MDYLKVDPVVHCPPEELPHDSAEPGGAGTALVFDVGNHRVVTPNPNCPAGNQRGKLTKGVEYSLQFQNIDMEMGEDRSHTLEVW